MTRIKYFPNYNLGTLAYKELTLPHYVNSKEYLEFVERDSPLWLKTKKWIAIEWLMIPEQGNRGIGRGSKLIKEFEAWAKQTYGDCGIILNPVPLDSCTSFDYLVRWYNHRGYYSANGESCTTMYKLL